MFPGPLHLILANGSPLLTSKGIRQAGLGRPEEWRKTRPRREVDTMNDQDIELLVRMIETRIAVLEQTNGTDKPTRDWVAGRLSAFHDAITEIRTVQTQTRLPLK